MFITYVIQKSRVLLDLVNCSKNCLHLIQFTPVHSPYLRSFVSSVSYTLLGLQSGFSLNVFLQHYCRNTLLQGHITKGTHYYRDTFLTHTPRHFLSVTFKHSPPLPLI